MQEDNDKGNERRRNGRRNNYEIRASLQVNLGLIESIYASSTTVGHLSHFDFSLIVPFKGT